VEGAVRVGGRSEGSSHAEEQRDVGLRNLWRFLAYSLPYWPLLVGGFIAGLVRMILPLYVPIFVKHVVDGALTPFVQKQATAAEAIHRFWNEVPLLLLLMGVHAVMTVGRFYLPNVAANSAIRNIRFHLFRHLQRLSLAFHTQRPTGGIVARLMSDVAAAQFAFDLLLIQTSQHLLNAGVIAVYLITKDWQWALVSFATLPIFVVTTRLLRRPMRRATREQREAVERMSGRVQERLAMIREVQSFTAETYEQRQLREDVEVLRRHTLRQQLLHGLLMAASEITRILGLVIVLGFGVYRVVYSNVTVGEVISFYMYVGMLLHPVESLSNLYTQLHVAAAAADRVFEFFDSEPDIKDAPGATVLNVRCPEVRYENVSFAYPRENPVIVLRNINLVAPPGSRIALVGESGSGKSTLLSLLPRFYDVQEGRVLIDGRDIRSVTLRSLRQAIGIVPQEPVLFSGTIRENVRYGRRDATEEEIRAAARAANAEEFILELPDGYDTVVGERGVGLSGGQIQRIAIARAFLRDPAILILDEATSNLDATSEALVLDAIERLAKGRTTFIIAHRLSTARQADLICVLKDGQIVERGKHEELLALNGEYAMLWERQMGWPTTASPPS